jgi:hypothetical protein
MTEIISMKADYKKVSLLKDDMEFWYVNFYDYKNPKMTKVSPPIVGEYEALKQYNRTLEQAFQDFNGYMN